MPSLTMTMAEFSTERMKKVIDTNVMGAFLCAREASRRLGASEAKNRNIVFISSAAARLGAPNEYVDYAGSKGAIESFVRCFALDCGRKKITVNAVAPGATVTDMFHETVRLYVPGGKDMSDEQIEKVTVAPVTTPFA